MICPSMEHLESVTMLRNLVSVTLLLVNVGICCAAEPPQARMDEKHREFLKTNCVACHNAEKQGARYGWMISSSRSIPSRGPICGRRFSMP